jgi:hypothetical protein
MCGVCASVCAQADACHVHACASRALVARLRAGRTELAGARLDLARFPVNSHHIPHSSLHVPSAPHKAEHAPHVRRVVGDGGVALLHLRPRGIAAVLVDAHDVLARIEVLERDGLWAMPLRVVTVQLHSLGVALLVPPVDFARRLRRIVMRRQDVDVEILGLCTPRQNQF